MTYKAYRHKIFGSALFKMRIFKKTITLFHANRRVSGEMDSLWVFLQENGVELTNNCAERAVLFGMLSRKRFNATQSDKGNLYVERMLSPMQTCRHLSLASLNILLEAMSCYYKKQQPNLSWIFRSFYSTPANMYEYNKNLVAQRD